MSACVQTKIGEYASMCADVIGPLVLAGVATCSPAAMWHQVSQGTTGQCCQQVCAAFNCRALQA
jgi:hypothetical protein